MANKAPAIVVITSTTGAGQSISAVSFTDVNNLEFDFLHNVIKVTRQGSGSTQVYDLSAIGTITVTVSGGLITFTIS